MSRHITLPMMLIFLLFTVTPALADPFLFSTGDPDGRMATASRPAGNGKIEIESADDFIVTAPATVINSATFTGLLTGASPSISQVIIEIYRVFPNDSNVSRTSGAPTFSTNQVPTRVNSPADVAFDSRDSAVLNSLSFTTTQLSNSFTAANSVLNGINPKPSQNTGGEGAVTGQEVKFTVNFTNPFSLPAGHYFFVPQVLTGDEFYWLSAPKPIISPGTPFSPDLQAWIRNANLDQDWLRVGTDIIGGAPPPAFNTAFSLTGEAVPLPASLPLLGSGLISLWGLRRLRNFRKN